MTTLPDAYARTMAKIRWALWTYLPDALAVVNASQGYTGPRALRAPKDISIALDFATIDPERQHWDQVPHLTLVPVFGQVVRRQPASDIQAEFALKVAWASDPSTLDESLHRAHVYAATAVGVIEERVADAPYSGCVLRIRNTSGFAPASARQLGRDAWLVEVSHRFELVARYTPAYQPTRAPALAQPGAYGANQQAVGPVTVGGVEVLPGRLTDVSATAGTVATGFPEGSPVILLRQGTTDPPVSATVSADGTVTLPTPLPVGEYTLTVVDQQTGAIGAYRVMVTT